MPESADLPEEIILNIFSRLPVKSLIRFTTVSKHLHFIILSDPKFAQSHLKAARRLSRRLLISTDIPQLESLPLDDAADGTPSFGDPSSVRKLTLPVLQLPRDHVLLLGSCNGLVFLICYMTDARKLFYIWNPSLGFLRKLPDPGFSSKNYTVWFYGAAYLSPADDYKILVTSSHFGVHNAWEIEVVLFSLTSHKWKRIESPGSAIALEPLSPGILSNDSLHWLDYGVYDLLCFDLSHLTEEVFRRMQLPSFGNDGKDSKLGVCGGCLCVSRLPVGVYDSIDLWVMKEYGVTDSWAMLFSLKLSDPPNSPLYPKEVLVLENSMVVMNYTAGGNKFIRIDHKDDIKLWYYMTEGHRCFMVQYEETLIWISGNQSGKETEQGQILETNSQS